MLDFIHYPERLLYDKSVWGKKKGVDCYEVYNHR